MLLPQSTIPRTICCISRGAILASDLITHMVWRMVSASRWRTCGWRGRTRCVSGTTEAGLRRGGRAGRRRRRRRSVTCVILRHVRLVLSVQRSAAILVRIRSAVGAACHGGPIGGWRIGRIVCTTRCCRRRVRSHMVVKVVPSLVLFTSCRGVISVCLLHQNDVC